MLGGRRRAIFILSVLLAAVAFLAVRVPELVPPSLQPARPPEVAERPMNPQVTPTDRGLIEVAARDPSILIRLRYATTGNFTGKVWYLSNKAYLTPGTLAKLSLAQANLMAQGLTLVIWDAYRPCSVQASLRAAAPFPALFASAATGSRHSRGAAVDVTLAKVHDGTELEMPTDFDDFTEQAARRHPGHSTTARANLLILERAMRQAGFVGNPAEWWHWSDPQWAAYPLLDVPIPP
ncbi:MAG: M15 family metallopeptidase [Bacillota bacterium]